METLLDKVLTRIKFPVQVFMKYVDGLLLAVPWEKFAEVLAIFNQAIIQFTVDVENIGRIPFVDLLLVYHIDKTKYGCYLR